MERIILGIDPGTTVMGFSVIQEQNASIKLITMDVLLLDKLDNQALKLKKIFETVVEIIDIYKPDELSIEAPFFGKNVQSMLKLGRAQGVAMAAALVRSIPIFEYSPKKVKQSIQVMVMLQKSRLQVCYDIWYFLKICHYIWMQRMH